MRATYTLVLIVLLATGGVRASVIFEDGFESGAFSPNWAVSEGGSGGKAIVDMIHSSSSAYEGSYHARSRNGISGNWGIMAAVIAGETFDPTKPYELSAYVACPDQLTPLVVLKLEAENQYGFWPVLQASLPYSSTGPTGYQKLTVTFDPQSHNLSGYAGAPIRICIETRLGLDHRWNYATAYIDNVQLLVPEPASLGLLALGGLPMFRRGRTA